MKKLGLLLITFAIMFLVFGCARGTTTDSFRFENREIDVLVGEEKEVALILGETSSVGNIIYHCEAISDDLSDNLLPASRILFMKGFSTTYGVRDTTYGKDQVLKVVGINPGKVKITAYVREEPNYVDSIIVNVVKEKLNAYQIVTEASTISVGEELLIETKGFPNNLPTDATYLSSDEDILIVSSDGVVTGVAPGVAFVYAQSQYDSSLVARKEITVKQVSLKEISPKIDTLSFFIGESKQIEVNYNPNKPSTQTRYVSNNEAVCTVDENGLVTAIGDGETTVTIYAGSKQADVKIVVGSLIETNLEFATEQEFVLNIGTNTSEEINYIVTPSQASQNLIIESSDSEICEVTAINGILTIKPLKVGNTKVTVSTKTGFFKQEFDVTVFVSPSDLVKSITVTGKKALAVGDTATLKVTINPSKPYDATVTWLSSDEAIATVDETGLVTGIAAGVVTITATANDGSEVTGTFEITISEPSGE